MISNEIRILIIICILLIIEWNLFPLKKGITFLVLNFCFKKKCKYCGKLELKKYLYNGICILCGKKRNAESKRVNSKDSFKCKCKKAWCFVEDGGKTEPCQQCGRVYIGKYDRHKHKLIPIEIGKGKGKTKYEIMNE